MLRKAAVFLFVAAACSGKGGEGDGDMDQQDMTPDPDGIADPVPDVDAVEDILPDLPDVADMDAEDDAPPRPAVYVSPEGDDANTGGYDDPVRTFDRALELWEPGYEVRAFAGVYNEQLRVDMSGTEADPVIILPVDGQEAVIDTTGSEAGRSIYLTGEHIRVEGFEVRGSVNQCVDASGRNLVLRNLTVHDCVSHGVMIGGTGVLVEGFVIYNTVLENENGTGGGWGSALKVKVDGSDIVLLRNRVYHNWGEGIAVTRGVGVTVRGNWSYDNYSVNIYIDNSYDVVVEGNLCTCTPDSGFERDGSRASGIAIGEEYYDGWGARLHNLVIQNNISAFCGRGLIYFGSDVGGALVDAVIVHNTLWGSVETTLSMGHDPGNTGILIANNLVQHDEGSTVWIEDRTGIDMNNNFWVGGEPEDWRNAAGTDDRWGDPGLTSTPDYLVASFRLGEASQARDGAAVMDSPVVDLDGTERYTTESPLADMGALEYVDSASPCAFDNQW
jgi:hypothetical protein